MQPQALIVPCWKRIEERGVGGGFGQGKGELSGIHLEVEMKCMKKTVITHTTKGLTKHKITRM